MDKIEELLEEEIRGDLESISHLAPECDKYSVAAENLSKLYKLKIEHDKIRAEREDKAEQKRETVKDRYVRIGIAAAEIVLPLIFYASWMRKGFKFEETGIYKSTTFRGLFNRFRPTK